MNVADKIERIRMVSEIKQQQLQQRRQAAIENQEQLRCFIEEQKQTILSERPFTYREQHSQLKSPLTARSSN
jgi:hypothetical protein